MPKWRSAPAPLHAWEPCKSTFRTITSARCDHAVKLQRRLTIYTPQARCWACAVDTHGASCVLYMSLWARRSRADASLGWFGEILANFSKIQHKHRFCFNCRLPICPSSHLPTTPAHTHAGPAAGECTLQEGVVGDRERERARLRHRHRRGQRAQGLWLRSARPPWGHRCRETAHTRTHTHPFIHPSITTSHERERMHRH
jgi:hypothetical protein